MQKLYKVKEVGKESKNHFFDSKKKAKDKRQELRGKGQAQAHVSLGPDHHNHITKRKVHGWNKGHHPKHGKFQSQHGAKPRGRGRLNGRG